MSLRTYFLTIKHYDWNCVLEFSGNAGSPDTYFDQGDPPEAYIEDGWLETGSGFVIRHFNNKELEGFQNDEALYEQMAEILVDVETSRAEDDYDDR